MTGDIRFIASQELPDFPYARFAESIGLHGIRLDRPENVTSAWEEALASDRPVILEAITDADVPTLPPHITLKEAKSFAETILKGDPNEVGIIRQATKQMVERFIPH